MARNPFIRNIKQVSSKPLDHQSAGILDDFAIRKNIATKEGTIEKEPVNDSDIANKKYVDDSAGGTGSMTTVKEDGTQVGGADIVILDFLGADFNLTESPDKEINIVINDGGIDHDLLLNFAANEHFTEASIDHVNILNIGTNTHAQIDTHISAAIEVATRYAYLAT